jgi:photosystem II stability/assembly factor-like uncharacterized protein
MRSSLGLALAMCIGMLAAPSKYAVFKTTDRGRTWSRADKGLPGNVRVNALGSVHDVVLAATDTGIFISRDQARSWQRSSSGVDGATGRMLSFATVGQTVFAGTDRSGVLISVDKGITWTRSARFPSPYVRSMLAHGARLYAGTDKDGVFVTDNQGASWTSMGQGLPAGGQIFAMTAAQGRLFAGLYSKGLYVWAEREQRWSKTGSVSPLALATVGETLIAGHNPGGLFRSDDLGATWAPATGEVPDKAPVWELGSGGDLVVAGASSGIYYSEDRGRTWTRSRTGLPTESPGTAFVSTESYFLATMLVSSSN